jgi:hypothetical protein
MVTDEPCKTNWEGLILLKIKPKEKKAVLVNPERLFLVPGMGEILTYGVLIIHIIHVWHTARSAAIFNRLRLVSDQCLGR